MQNLVVGQKISVTTTHGELVEGICFSKQPALDLVVIMQVDQDHRSYSMVKGRSIKALVVLDDRIDPVIKEPLPPVDKEANRMRELKAVKKASDQMAIKFGKTASGQSVSRQAQHIFNTIDKTLSCTWDNEIIVVMNTVQVHPPYTLDTIQPITKNDRMLEHVKKIVNSITAGS